MTEEYDYSGKSDTQDLWDEFIEEYIKIQKILQERKHIDLRKLLPIQSEDEAILDDGM